MRRVVVLLAVLALVVTACGNKEKVGSKSLVNFKEQAQQRLGQRTTTSQAATTTTAASSGRAALGTPTTQRSTQTTLAAAYDIVINSDTASPPGFDPQEAKVFKGTVVRWTNHDTVNRSVEFEDGSYSSGPIAPGRSAEYTTTKAGSFAYSDGTRVYRTATLEVMAK